VDPTHTRERENEILWVVTFVEVVHFESSFLLSYTHTPAQGSTHSTLTLTPLSEETTPTTKHHKKKRMLMRWRLLQMSGTTGQYRQ